MKTLSLVGRVAALALLAEVIVTPGLWWPDGLLAPIPVWASVAPNVAAWRALTALLCLGCAWAVVDGGRRALQVALALLLVRCGADRVLWQPYALEQCALLAGACFVDDAREEDVAEALRWLLGLVFIWGGVHKWNDSFLADGLAWVPFALPRGAAHAVAIGEVALGVAAIVPRARSVARYGVVAFSLAVGATLLLARRNPAVLPWNLSHVPLALLLLRDGSPRKAARHPFAWGVALVFGALPFAYPLGWPPYLALRVYTADSLRAMYLVDDPAALPPAARAVARHDAVGALSTSVDLEHWAHAETGGFVPPEAPCFRAVLARLCARSPQGRVLMVMVQPREPRTRYERCAGGVSSSRGARRPGASPGVATAPR
jgi:uncharacterized membrane protein